MSDRKIYIVAISEPDPRISPRHTLDDARELVTQQKSRFPKANVKIWQVNTDGSVEASND